MQSNVYLFFTMTALMAVGVSAASQNDRQHVRLSLDAAPGSGQDVGAQINATYAACPSHGCTIEVGVPEAGLRFSTPVVIGTANKPAVIQCLANAGQNGGGLIFVPDQGTAFTFDYGPGTHSYGPRGAGLRDCLLQGRGSAVGVTLGGQNGAEGFYGESTTIVGFGTDLLYGPNTWATTWMHSYFMKAGQYLLNIPSGSGNAGEQIDFVDVTFGGQTPSAFRDSVKLGGPATHVGLQANFLNCSFDNAQLSAQASLVNVVNPHFENPANYPLPGPYVVVNGGNVNVENPQFFQDHTKENAPTARSMILLAGGFTNITGTNAFSLNFTYPALIEIRGTANLNYTKPLFVSGFTQVLAGKTSGRYLVEAALGRYSSNAAITLDAPVVAPKGLILQSPTGTTCRRLGIDERGSITAVAAPCE